MKNRWSVTLPNSSVKRFQSKDAADSYAELYNGVVSAPPRSADETAGEPPETEAGVGVAPPTE